MYFRNVRMKSQLFFHSKTLTDTAELNETAIYFATIDQNSDVLTVILKVKENLITNYSSSLFDGAMMYFVDKI